VIDMSHLKRAQEMKKLLIVNRFLSLQHITSMSNVQKDNNFTKYEHILTTNISFIIFSV